MREEEDKMQYRDSEEINYTTTSAAVAMKTALGRNPLEHQDTEQIAGDLLHMYGWVCQLTPEQEKYVFGQHEDIADFISDGKTLEQITRYLFCRMPRELGKIKKCESFSEHYRPKKGRLASLSDTVTILERFPIQERRGKRDISQGLRSTIKEITNLAMRKENYENI